jgi:hypothetical protein
MQTIDVDYIIKPELAAGKVTLVPHSRDNHTRYNS